MKKIIVTVAILIVCAGLITWKLFANKKEINSKAEVKTTIENIAVTTADVQKQSSETGLSLTGVTEANQTVMVASKASGEITQINIKLGDFVTKGQILARVDDTYAKFALENAKVNYGKFKEDVQRYQTLREGDAVSETQLRDIKVAYENAKIQLDQAQRQLEDTYIRAPFSGYITSREVDLGKFVGISTPIAGIADISALKVVVAVPEAGVYSLKNGQSVAITTPVYSGVNFAGKIAHISPQGDNSHSYPVEITLPNSNQNPLKSGTYVDVSIDMGKTQPMLFIPRDAIVSSVKDPSVYRVEGNMVKLIKITTGRDYENNIEVLHGLQEGDKVVVSGQINLMDGATVSVIGSTQRTVGL